MSRLKRRTLMHRVFGVYTRRGFDASRVILEVAGIDVYVCLVPCLPINVSFVWRWYE